MFSRPSTSRRTSRGRTRGQTSAARLRAEPHWQAARRLLDQQCWCFGRDVEAIPGNALVLRGLDRFPPKSRVYHHSYYAGVVRGADVVLWSWGLFHRVPGGDAVLLRRASLDPVLVESAESPRDVWCSELVAHRRTAETDSELRRFLTAAADAFDWLAGYEEWVRSKFGLPYREEALLQWKRLCAPAGDMAARWAELAEWCRSGVAADDSEDHAAVAAG